MWDLLEINKKFVHNTAICKIFRKYVTFYSDCDIMYFKMKIYTHLCSEDCSGLVIKGSIMFAVEFSVHENSVLHEER